MIHITLDSYTKIKPSFFDFLSDLLTYIGCLAASIFNRFGPIMNWLRKWLWKV